MATFTVTTLADEAFGGGNLAAETADGGGLSLREALELANADNLTSDTIAFDAALTGGNTPGVDDGTIVLTSGELTISGAVTILGDVDGDDAPDIIVDADGGSRAFSVGDGVAVFSAVLDGLVIAGGSATGDGGGLLNRGATLAISDSIFYGNEATGDGGGVFTDGGTVTVGRTGFTGNYAANGGALGNAGGVVTVANAIFLGNGANTSGGAIFNTGAASELKLLNSTLSANTADYGAALYNSAGASADLVNVTIAGNDAYCGGGGIENLNADVSILSSTITGNYADFGGGLNIHGGSVTIANSIVAGNEADTSSDNLYVTGGATATYSGANVFSEAGLGDAEDIVETDLGEIFASVAVNPFTGVLSGVLGDNGGSSPTVAILAGGVAEDAADEAALPADATDLDGDTDVAEPLPVDGRGFARDVGAAPDIGALELAQGATFIVTTLDDDAFDGGDLAAELADGGGLSLREALELANADGLSADTITFDPGLTAVGNPAANDSVISLVNGPLEIVGNVTVNGDVNNNNVPDITIDAGGISSGLYVESGTVLLNGLRFVNGYGDFGGAIAVGTPFGPPGSGADVTIDNSAFVANHAYYGGAIIVGADSKLRIEDSYLGQNSADYQGGAIASDGLLEIVNTIINNNTVVGSAGLYYGGGAIWNYGRANISGSTISSNTSLSNYGGGIYNFGNMTITDTSIFNNFSGAGGGGIFSAYGCGCYGPGAGTLTIVNSTIAGNSAAEDGGGILNLARLLVVSSTLSDNSAGDYGGGASLSGSSTFINATLAGNTADDGAGIDNTGALTFLNGTITDNTAAGSGGGIYNGAGTILLANSIVAGNSAASDGDLAGTAKAGLDLRGVNLFSQSGIARLGIDIEETNMANVFAGPLANNGGLVETIALLTGGAAHNTGLAGSNPNDLLDLDGDGKVDDGLPFDARGGARVLGPAVDIGAFELNAPPAAAVNAGLTLLEGASAKVTGALLRFSDPDNQPQGIFYTLSSAATNGVLTLRGNALGVGDTFSQSDINNGRVAYAHNGGETTNAAFAFSVSDGTNTVTGQTFAIAVTPQNDLPTLSGIVAAQTYTENAPPKTLDGSVTIADVDNATLASATVRIASFLAGDQLLVGGLATGSSGGVSWHYAPATGILTLTGVAPQATYKTLLEQVQYRSSSDNPTDFGGAPTRTITWRIFDGAGFSTPASTVLTITALNDGATAISGPQLRAAEFAATGAVVGQLTSNDPDSAPVFTLLDNAGGRFSITAGGQVRVANGLLIDREQAASYQITVRASDQLGAYLDKVVTIDVINVEPEVFGGTSAAETFRGGKLADTISGNGGSDRLEGGDGDDHLFGNANDDTLFGGLGQDTLDGGSGDDQLHGDNGDDTISGGAGDDTIGGDSGNDTIAGGDGDDDLLGGDGADTISGGHGKDDIDGNAGDDTLNGDGGEDDIDGGAGADIIHGGDGNDTIHGGYGGVTGDTIFGDGGDDTIVGGGHDVADILDGGQGNDTITASSAGSTLRGGSGNDSLTGSVGGDFLFGQAGIDTLDGGRGDDLLDGGADADTFVFRPLFGRDIIAQFQDGAAAAQDVIAVATSLFADFAAVAANLSQAGTSVLLSYNAANQVEILNTTVAQFTADDFLFIA